MEFSREIFKELFGRSFSQNRPGYHAEVKRPFFALLEPYLSADNSVISNLIILVYTK